MNPTALPLTKIQSSQPQGAARINRGNFFGRHCVAAVVPSIRSEIISGKQNTRAASCTLVSTNKDGIAFQHATTTGNVDFGVAAGLSSILDVNAPFSFYLRVYIAATTQQGIIADSAVGGSAESFWFQINASGNYEFKVNGSILSGGAASVGYHDIICVHASSATFIYVDGALVGSGSVGVPRPAGTSLRLGSFGVYPTLMFTGQCSLCYIFDTDLSKAVVAFRANPWQVLKTDSYFLRTDAAAAVPSRQYGLRSMDTLLIPAIQPTNQVYQL